jgi:hypothetical protein
MDVARIAGDLDEELSKTEKYSEPPPLVERKKTTLDFFMLQLSKLNWRIFVPGVAIVLFLLVFVVGFRACHNRQKDDPLKDLGPGLYKPKPNQTGDKLPVTAPPPRKQ